MNIRSPISNLLLFLCLAASAFGQGVQYVIHISVDGGRSSYIHDLIDGNQLPYFKCFQTEGAWTYNARSDYNFTVTLPNHTTQVTGRGILGATGHNWTDNGDPAPDQTIHTNKGSYVAGVFDVAHDNGLKTGMYAGKTKFSLFDTSYNAINGALDMISGDNGRDKIDTYVYDGDSSALIAGFISTMQTDPLNYAFIHFADPDAAGHNSSWGSNDYNNALITIDDYLRQIFTLVTSDATLNGKTAIVLTADHGGNGYDHSDAADPLDYTIPFGVWGPGVMAGADLYALNSSTRLDPGTGRPPYSASVQPIRNGDAPNLELELLGLPAIPGSTINSLQNLAVPEPATLTTLTAALLCLLVCRLCTRKRN